MRDWVRDSFVSAAPLPPKVYAYNRGVETTEPTESIVKNRIHEAFLGVFTKLATATKEDGTVDFGKLFEESPVDNRENGSMVDRLLEVGHQGDATLGSTSSGREGTGRRPPFDQDPGNVQPSS